MTSARDASSVERTSQGLALAERLALLYAASIPFEGLAIGGRSLPFVVGAVYLTASILTRLTSKRRQVGDDLPIRPILPATFFTLFCVVSYFWSVAPDLTITRVTSLVVLLVTSWFLSQDLSRVSKHIPVVFVLGALPVVILVLAAPMSITGRRTASGNANQVALDLLLAVVCALWLLLRRRGRARFLGATSIALLIAGVVATGSRTAIVAGGGALLAIVGWLAWKHQGRQLMLLLVLSVLGAKVFSVLPVGMIPSRLITVQSAVEAGSFGGREYIWSVILERGFDLTGIGAGTTSAYLQQATGIPYVSHNVFLGVVLETGLLGMLLFLMILVKAAIDARRSPYRELLFFMLPVMVASSMALTLESTRPFWFVLSLAWAVKPRESECPRWPDHLRPATTVKSAIHGLHP